MSIHTKLFKKIIRLKEKIILYSNIVHKYSLDCVD